MKKIFKYGTGHEVPEGAKYLTTVVEIVEIDAEDNMSSTSEVPYRSTRRLVWHYFLVEIENETKR